MSSVLAITIHSKYVAASPAIARQIFSHAVAVVTDASGTNKAVMNSSLFEYWTITYGSSLETRVRFTPTDCFETFPFPEYTASLDAIGNEYLGTRIAAMRSLNLGLTSYYNRIHDPSQNDQEFGDLRKLKIKLDNAVVLAFGWDDVALEHSFHETKHGMRFTISEAARREVLDRLLELNHQRYAEEVAQGLHEKGAKGKAKRQSAAQKSLL